MLIIVIAVLFKINSLGIHTCAPPAFLCGPTALLLLGIGYEVFASVFIKRNQFRYSNYLLTCVLTSLVIFCVYAILQTYILGSWDTDRLINYISVRGSLTAVASSALSIFGLYLAKSFGNVSIARFNPYVINGILGSVIIALWVLGYYSV